MERIKAEARQEALCEAVAAQAEAVISLVGLVGVDKSSCLTAGVKSIKDAHFSLSQDEVYGQVSKAYAMRAPAVKDGTNSNPSPVKNKTPGGKGAS
ncbi:hypothetical protein C8Q73DRAFT_794041 [Cubamyces lactineus]|nr:hypothetical protein C8Q73DRAFT_794041 [Cubamyces lactineus]